MADNIPFPNNKQISAYDVIKGNTCSSYSEFVENVNTYIKNGYQPYGWLVTGKHGTYCGNFYQVVVKYADSKLNSKTDNC
jgi:hypothetical protein